EDALALTFDSVPLDERIEILGTPVVSLELRSDRPQAHVAIRLTDVAPDGGSLLISRGLLNLSHHDNHQTVRLLVPAEPTSVRVVLDVAGHAFEAGHRIRIALSPTYWPIAWPSPEIVTLGISTGAASSLELPVRPPAAEDADLPAFEQAEHAAPLDVEDSSIRRRRIVRDMLAGSWRVELEGSELTVLPSGLASGERGTETYSIVEGDPLSARIDRAYLHELRRGDWRIASDTRTSLSATATEFVLSTELEVFEGDELVHRISRTRSFPRDGA
ncbi:MAG: CocE/NonD family hydrolase C-terminal non-catalytic domain-containing protein, partial [Gaiellales bacterium]